MDTDVNEQLRGFAKNCFPKNLVYYESGWVGLGLTRNFFYRKSSEYSSKPVLIFWSSIPCVFCLHNYTLLKVVSYCDLSAELSTLSHSYLYDHEQQSLRFVEHPYNFNIANKTRA